MNWFRCIVILFALPSLAQKSLLPDTILLCERDSAWIEVRHELGERATIKWNTPAGVFSNTKKVRAFAAGRYMVRVTSADLKITHIDSSFVKVLPRPRSVLIDTVFCAGRELVLDAGNAGMRYQWNTGEKTRRITVRKEGVYTVKISNGRCSVTDTAKVSVMGVRDPLGGNEVQFCLNDYPRVLSVKGSRDLQVRWNTGVVSHTIHAASEGMYSVLVSHPRCGEQSDSIKVKLKACDCEILIPNRFTPNEDGRNDYFFPVLNCEYSYFRLTISDRWGNIVYDSFDATGKWDGRYKGNLCPEDIYIFTLETTEKATGKKDAREGSVALIR